MNSVSLLLLAIVTGLFISTNPFAINVFSKLLATYKNKGSKGTVKMLHPFIYIATLWISLSAIGFICYSSLSSVNLKDSKYLAISLAGIGIIIGLLEIRKYYWPSKVSEKRTERIHRNLLKESGLLSVIKLSFETLSENLGSYIFATILFSVLMTFTSKPKVYYIFIFSAALLFSLIKILILKGLKINMTSVLEWNRERKNLFRICMGIGCILLSWLLLLVVSDVIGLK
jgi:hypothetical protein